MNSGTVRFVHRPIQDEGQRPGDEALPETKDPLIDRDGIKPTVSRGRTAHSSWLGAVFTRLFGAGGRTTSSVSSRKLDPQRWLPKE